MPEGEKSARNHQRDKKSPQSNKREWICQIMQVQKRVSYGCKGDCSVGCALASPALCWKLPLNQSTQNVTELRPAVVSMLPVCRNGCTQLHGIIQLHGQFSALSDNGWELLKCWLKGSRPSALLCLPVLCFVLSLVSPWHTCTTWSCLLAGNYLFEQ